MAYHNLTIQELARHIGMDARDVLRMAERGQLPGQKVGGEWRFNRATLLDWLQIEMHALGVEQIRSLEQALADNDETGVEALLAACLCREGIDLHLPARSKNSVLRELVRLAERTGLVYDADGILTALEQREEARATALPGGIALPHPRRPLPYAVASSLICYGRVPAGIPFGGPDGKLTRLFFLVCCPHETVHLRALARLAMIFSHNSIEELAEIDDADAALAWLIKAEQSAMSTGR